MVAPRFAMQKAAGPSGDHYLFDTDHGTGTAVYRIVSGVNTTLLNQPLAYAVNVDYRTKIRVGAAGTGTVQVWRNEVLLGTGNDTAPLGSGNFSFHVGNFNTGGTVDYDNMAIYKSTKLTVNGTYGSWALYKNDGTTPVGTCNTSSIVDYAAVTSFPADYAAGSASQIKVFPVGVTNCTGAPAAVYAGSPAMRSLAAMCLRLRLNTDACDRVFWCFCGSVRKVQQKERSWYFGGGDQTKTLNPKGTMTKKESKRSRQEIKALMSQEEDFLRPLMKVTLQEVLEAEMDEAVGAAKSERSSVRLGYRSGYYQRKLITRVGTLELRVPQDRQGRFSTEVFSATNAARRRWWRHWWRCMCKESRRAKSKRSAKSSAGTSLARAR